MYLVSVVAATGGFLFRSVTLPWFPAPLFSFKNNSISTLIRWDLRSAVRRLDAFLRHSLPDP